MNLYNYIYEQDKFKNMNKKEIVEGIISNMDESSLEMVIEAISDIYIMSELKDYLKDDKKIPDINSKEFKFLVISNQYNGNVIRKIMLDEAISKYYLTQFIHKYRLEPTGTGSWIFPNADIDVPFVFQQRYHRSVISHESALYLHELSDVIPTTIKMSMPYNYKLSQVTIDHTSQDKNIVNSDDYFRPKIEVVNNRDIEYDEIVLKKSNIGNPVRATSVLRSIVDIVKKSAEVEEEIKFTAVKRFVEKFPNDRTKLRMLAKKYGVLEELDDYLIMFTF